MRVKIILIDNDLEEHLFDRALPEVMGKELELISVFACYAGCREMENLASLYARMCSIGVDAVLKEYGARRYEAKSGEIDAIIPTGP